MNKIITEAQINAVLQAIYNTNIPASQFDAIKKLFIDLPKEKVVTKEEKKDETNTTKQDTTKGDGAVA